MQHARAYVDDDAPTIVRRIDTLEREEPLEERYDGEDDEEDFVEPFSLLENVVDASLARGTRETEARAVAQVIHYREGEVIDVSSASSRRARVTIGADGFELLRALPSGRALLRWRARDRGTIIRRGKAVPLAEISRRRAARAVELVEGDYAQVLRPDGGYLVRFVRPPRLPASRAALPFDRWSFQYLTGSVAFHFLLLVIVGLVVPAGGELYVAEEAPRRPHIPRDPRLDPQKTVAATLAEPPPRPTKPSKIRRQRPRRSRATRASGARRRAAARAPSVSERAAGRLLAAVSSSAVRPAGRSDLARFTSIAAVRSSSVGFRTAGLAQKLGGGRIRLVGTGGGGGRDTRGGRRLLASSGAGALVATPGIGRRGPIGRVRKVPLRRRDIWGEGHLSREAIQRVVSRHMRAIQSCYERQLIFDRRLSGKATFDWTIAPGGAVSSCRLATSSLSSSKVVSCILRQIRSWRFPRPQGGSVRVRYPFVFRLHRF